MSIGRVCTYILIGMVSVGIKNKKLYSAHKSTRNTYFISRRCSFSTNESSKDCSPVKQKNINIRQIAQQHRFEDVSAMGE